MEWIELNRLRPHEMNANAMSGELFEKLVRHIGRSGRYPPLIVRPIGDHSGGEAYQVLDGHHRWRAIERLGHERAACIVWQVDDDEATLLLTTLNRLTGRDDPKRRAALLAELHERCGRSVQDLADLLPENAEQVQRWLEVRAKLPKPAEPRPLEQMPVAVHFFLTGAQRQRLEHTLKRIGGKREAALMQLIAAHNATTMDEGGTA